MNHHRYGLFGFKYSAADAIVARVKTAGRTAFEESYAGDRTVRELRARIDELTEIVGHLVAALEKGHAGAVVASMTIRPDTIDYPSFPSEAKPND